MNKCVQLFDYKSFVHLYSTAQKIELDTLQETKHSLLDLLDRYPIPEDMLPLSDTDSD